MSFENNSSNVEKASNKGFESAERNNANLEALELLGNNDSFNNAGNDRQNNPNGFPATDNILDTQDTETRKAFGLEDAKSDDSTKQNQEGSKDGIDKGKGEKELAEGPKLDAKAEQTNAHDATKVDHQEGESSDDNKDASANKDGIDKKSKAGDADKDTDDGGDNRSLESGPDSVNGGPRGGKQEELGQDLGEVDTDPKSESFDEKTNDKASIDNEVLQEKEDAPDSDSDTSSKEDSQSPDDKPEGPKSDSEDSDIDNEQQKPKNEDSEGDTIIGVNGESPELSEVLEQAHKNADNANLLARGSQINKADNQATINKGLQYATTQALYRPTYSLK